MGGCYSKKAAKAALKKHRMERPGKKSQRGNSTNNNNINNSSSSKKITTAFSRNSSKHSSTTALPSHEEQQKEVVVGQQDGPSHLASRGRKVAKSSAAKDDGKSRAIAASPASLSATLSRTRSGSRSSGSGTSPAALHGRISTPHKTAVVAPAKIITPRSGTLNRFGFRNSLNSKSGDSTDSVNSILSDAQTASDSNSNIYDFCDDENDNKPTNVSAHKTSNLNTKKSANISVPTYKPTSNSTNKTANKSTNGKNESTSNASKQCDNIRVHQKKGESSESPSKSLYKNSPRNPLRTKLTSSQTLTTCQSVTNSFSKGVNCNQSLPTQQSFVTLSNHSLSSNGTLTSSQTTIAPKPSPGIQSSRFTAHTRQLPKPQQAVTVKAVGSENESHLEGSNCLISNFTDSQSDSINDYNSLASKDHCSSLSQITSERAKSSSVRSLTFTSVSQSLPGHSPLPRHNLMNIATAPTSRVSRDSESSTKSGTEIDSGLGSSSESDRIRGDGETDTLDSCNSCTVDQCDTCKVESTGDMSDAWLKKVRQQQNGSSKRKSRGSAELQISGNLFEVKRQSLEISEDRESLSGSSSKNKSSLERRLEHKDSLKEKRENTITYSMARQKFAPYSRSRYGFGYQSGISRIGSTSTTTSGSVSNSPNSASRIGGGDGARTTSLTPSNSGVGSHGNSLSNSITSSPNTQNPIITKIPGSAGLVRSRIALLETPSVKKTTNQHSSVTPQSSVLRRTNLKKPLIRPTSIEKTPILVMPVPEKTVDLSKPVCRKLEYCENAKPKNDFHVYSSTQKDIEGENQDGKDGKEFVNLSKPIVEDILIVGSVEVETQKDGNLISETENYGSFYENSRRLENDLSKKDSPLSIRMSENKAHKDITENEKLEKVSLKSSEKESSMKTKPVMVDKGAFETGNDNAERKSGDCVESSGELVTPDDSGIKILSPQSESSFEILESLSETSDLITDLTMELTSEPAADLKLDETRGSHNMSVESGSSVDSASSADTTVATVQRGHEEQKYIKLLDTKKNEDSGGRTYNPEGTEDLQNNIVKGVVRNVEDNSREGKTDKPHLQSQSSVTVGNDVPSLDQPQEVLKSAKVVSAVCALTVASGINSPVTCDKKRAQFGQCSQDAIITEAKSEAAVGATASTKNVQPEVKDARADLRNSMESSVDSHKSLSMVNAMVESGDLSNTSGKNTPTLNTGRSDLDQDFLIDDEIADQPGLMFGGSNMASSFFTDDGLFDDIASSPPSHAQLKQVIAGSSRSRADSVDTTSSVGGDDLMLDYFDIEETKAGGSSNRSSIGSSLSLPVCLTSSLTSNASNPISVGARPKHMQLRISIPGRRYDEEVLSPDASEIFSEWTAMMAEVSSVVSDRCVSREGSYSSSSGGGGGGGDVRTSRPRLSSHSEFSSPDPRRQTVLRPPRQCGATDSEGLLYVDRTSYHYMYQDVTALKTMLLRLRRVLQAADTMNPFDANLRNSLYLSLATADTSIGCVNGDKDLSTPNVVEVSQENVDLKRQVVLLQQQLEDKDRTIRLLQQQIQSVQAPPHLSQSQSSQSSQSSTSHTPPLITAEGLIETVNAATQTDRSSRPALRGSSLSRTASTDDGLGPTVSSELHRDQAVRGRSLSTDEHHHPRAASQPPTPFTRY
ncbi:hypothetical protein SK128_014468 [Halocaridina rubra]|uniref:Uncharacterized protein n=1 Tax=Halocaridina rubra TaxID=373956 RepID=A0AAN8WNI7_HALRR